MHPEKSLASPQSVQHKALEQDALSFVKGLEKGRHRILQRSNISAKADFTWHLNNHQPDPKFTGTYLDGVWSLGLRIKSICFDIFSGWWFQPLWKIWKSVGMMKSPIYGKIKLMFQTTNQFLMCLVLSTYFNHLNSPSRISLWNPKWSDSAGWTCQWPVPAFRPRWRSPGGRGGHFMQKNIEASLQDASLQWWLLVYNPHEKYSYLSYL